MTAAPQQQSPIPIERLECPKCQLWHVDEGEWATTRPHKTHLCVGCGYEWRPSGYDGPTVGVNPMNAPQDSEKAT